MVINILVTITLTCIRPFEMQEPCGCTKLKVNKPCYWPAGFVHLLFVNGRVFFTFCKPITGFLYLKLGTRFLHIERSYSFQCCVEINFITFYAYEILWFTSSIRSSSPASLSFRVISSILFFLFIRMRCFSRICFRLSSKL